MTRTRLAGFVMLLLIAGAAAGAVLAGRSGGVAGGGQAPGQPMTQRQATARDEQLVRATAAVLHPRAPVSFAASELNTIAQCRAADLPAGSTLDAALMVSIQRGAAITGISGDRASVTGRVAAYWQREGFQVTSTAAAGAPQPSLIAGTGTPGSFDAFSLGFTITGDGTAEISVQSPCAWAAVRPGR